MITKIKKNYLYILEVLVFILFFCHLTYYANRSKFGYFYLNSFTVITLIVGVMLICGFAFVFSKLKKLKMEQKFLIIVPILGILYLASFPFTAVPDEFNHATRAYEISNGYLTSRNYKKIVGNKLDSSISKVFSNKNYNELINNFKYKTTGKKVKYSFANTALYSPISYLPQSFGIFISRLLTNRILLQLYFGRIFNFLAFLVLMYYSIKLIPFKKSIMFLIGMLPVVFQEAISLSPDAFTISVVCFLISYVLYLKDGRRKVNSKDIVILSLSSVVLSQLKIVYLPICLFIFLLPTDKFKSKKSKYITLVSIFFASVLASLIWLKISSPYLKVQSDSNQQLTYILTNMVRYFGICTSTFINLSREWMYDMFGRSLGYYTVIVPSFLIFGNIIYFIFETLIMENKRENLKKWEKLFILLIIIVIIGLIFTSLYLQWTPYKADLVKGIQGRYFTPLLILIALVLSNKKLVLKEKFDSKYFDLFFLFENVCTLSMIFIYFM